MAQVKGLFNKRHLQCITAVTIFFVFAFNIILSLNIHTHLKLESKIQVNSIPPNAVEDRGYLFSSQKTPVKLNKNSILSKLPLPTNSRKNNKTQNERKEKIDGNKTGRKHKDFRKQESKGICPEYKITGSKSFVDKNKIECKPHRPSDEACQFAEELYSFDESLMDCKNNLKQDYCSFENSKLRCVIPEQCEKINIHGIDKRKGILESKGTFESTQSLQNGLSKIMFDLDTDGFRFVYIDCFPKNINISLPKQLLSWKLNGSPRQSHLEHKNINLNIVLLDSISRAHFYRSLPRVIDEFEYQNQESNVAEVLDFSLFQSVHGHSAENAHALFTGELFPNSMSDEEVDNAPVGIEKFFGHFKVAGYQTMYQDDLCWKHVWGLRKELGIPKTWGKFLSKINSSHIDDSGLTMANCEILKSLGLKNPFGESKDNQICFNGRFQHDYILEYSALFHENSNVPTMSYTALNTAHDWHGLRVQTLNKGLVNYIKRMSQVDNTLTILMADHGNTYTPFVRKILEGRYEMYHPSLFMLIPNGVKQKLGPDIMSNLIANQNHLVTMLDINPALLSITKQSREGMVTSQKGIFNLIPPKRTCDDIDLKLPNLCVCDNWDNEASNDSMQVSVVEFGVGVLNNIIDEQRQKYQVENSVMSREEKTVAIENEKWIGERRCQHLVPLYFKNVRERNNRDILITSFDFVVPSGDGTGQKEDIFHVEVESIIKPGVLMNYMKLLNFERLSRYGPYRECADEGVDVKLCVCSLKNNSNSTEQVLVQNVWKFMPKYASIPSKKLLYNKVNDNCLYILVRYYHVLDNGKLDMKRLQTSALEAVNVCSNKSFQIRVTIKPHLMKVSGGKTFDVVVHGNNIVFLCVIATENVSWPASHTFIYERNEL